MPWLNVKYNYDLYHIQSTDRLIAGALNRNDYDSGACIGGPPERDLNFYYPSTRAAEAALRKLEASGVPVAFETSITGR